MKYPHQVSCLNQYFIVVIQKTTQESCQIRKAFFLFKLHLVHWNKSRYNSFGEAADKSDGLAVLGFFIKVCIVLFA